MATRQRRQEIRELLEVLENRTRGREGKVWWYKHTDIAQGLTEQCPLPPTQDSEMHLCQGVNYILELTKWSVVP